MDRLTSGRPPSSRPISSVPIPRTAMSARPITQQGLTGLRPMQSSSGTGTNRMYRDKRYYLALIQKKTNATKDEIARLMKETKDFRISSINLPELERNAKEMATTLSEKQEELNVLNMVLDLHLSKTSLSDIERESSRLEREHEALSREIEQGYQRNGALEKELTGLKKNMAKRDRMLQEKVSEMPVEEKDMYYQIVAKNEEYLAKINEMQNEIKQKQEFVNVQRANIAQSAVKQKFYEKLLHVEKLKHERDDLKEFVENTKTPEQERQILLEQLKKEKSDIEALSKVKAALEKQIEEAERKSTDLDRELDGKDNARLKKHKELRERGEHMESFISSYDEKADEVRGKIAVQQRQIEVALECVAEAEAESNLKELQINLDEDNDGSLEHWRNKYTVLKKNMERGASILKRYQDEIKNVREKKEKILEEHEKYKNPQERLQELVVKKAELLEHQAVLQATLDSTKSAVAEAERAKSEEMRKIEDNEEISELMKLDMEIEEMENRKTDLLKQIEDESRNEEYDAIMDNIGELLKERNEQLIMSLKNKKLKGKFE